LGDAYKHAKQLRRRSQRSSLRPKPSPKKLWNSIPRWLIRTQFIGGVETEYYWQFAAGEAELKKAVELDPSDATAYQWLSEELGEIGGRAQEAIDDGNRARQLDPISPIIGAQQAQAYTVAHQFDKAIELYSKLIAENPTFGRAHSEMGDCVLGPDKYAEAIREWKLGAHLEGDKNYIEWADNLDAAFGTGGLPAAVRRGIDICLAQRKAKSGYVSPYQIAQLYADIDDKEHAFQWLNTAYEIRDSSIIDIRPTPRSTPCALTPATRSWYARSDYRSRGNNGRPSSFVYGSVPASIISFPSTCATAGYAVTFRLRRSLGNCDFSSHKPSSVAAAQVSEINASCSRSVTRLPWP